MKKSEKIEIRLSIDEKEQLSRLAESEGRSLSELVLGLAKKYAQLNMPHPNRRLTVWAMSGLIFCGLVIGVGLAAHLSENKTHILTSHYTVHGVIANIGFGFSLSDQVGNTYVADLDEDGNKYQIHVLIMTGEDRPVAQFEICRLQKVNV